MKIEPYTVINGEYFCFSCGQLRLCCVPFESCGNCGAKGVLFGAQGDLNKELLLFLRDSSVRPKDLKELPDLVKAVGEQLVKLGAQREPQ